MRKKVYILLLTMALAIGFSTITYASGSYLTQFRSKYGTGITIDTCSLCHPGGNTGSLNQFANDFASASIGNYTFNTTLENRDSDGDTFTNIIEINARTYPGNPNSKPSGPADTTPPTVSLSIGSFLTPRKVNITLTATDNVGGSGVSRYMVKLSPTPPTKSSLNWKLAAPIAFTFPLTLTTGSQTLYAFAKDKAGNVSAAASAAVNLDRTKPAITAFSAQATSPASGTVNISITATDPAVNGVSSGVTAYMITRSNLTPPLASSPKWISGSTPPTTTILSTTVKTGAMLYAWVKDANGNVSKPKGAKVTASAASVAAQQAQSKIEPVAQSLQKTQVTAVPDTPAELTVWVGKWFKLSMKNQGFYIGKSGLSSDRQNVSGYLKIRDWDAENGVFQADLYLHDVQKDQWSSETLTLHYISGSELDFKIWSQVTGDLTYGFAARIQGTETIGDLTSATFKTLGGYHVQEDADAGTTQDVAGWLAIAGKMVSESEVLMPTGTILN